MHLIAVFWNWACWARVRLIPPSALCQELKVVNMIKKGDVKRLGSVYISQRNQISALTKLRKPK
jgi:hypothetical protein